MAVHSRLLCLALLALPCASCGDDGAADDGGSGATGAGGSIGTGAAGGQGGGGGGTTGPTRVRVGQFNLREMSTDKLLDPNDEQANAAAQIIARFSPDILSINELTFDIEGEPTASMPGAAKSTTWGSFDVPGAENANRLADRAAVAGLPTPYEHTLHTVGNSGYYWTGGTGGFDEFILRGWGEWKGRHNTAILSRHPILRDQVRVISDFAWEDLPDNTIAQMTVDTGIEVPAGFPLFEKALIIVPVQVGAEVLHLVLLHPVSPAFDAINPYRNHDELRAMQLFLGGQLPGVDPLPEGAKFIIIGDLNADPEDGDGLDGTIQQILELSSIFPTYPEGAGTEGFNGQRNTYLSGCGRDDGTTVDDPTERFQLQLDYLLPSVTLGEPLETFLFWPDHVSNREDFDLACRASDHRFLYVDVEL